LLQLLVGEDEETWKVLQKFTVCFNVGMCAAVTGWVDEGEWKVLQKDIESCNGVMCGIFTGWGRRREIESVKECY
jgi:hypothetical protein